MPVGQEATDFGGGGGFARVAADRVAPGVEPDRGAGVVQHQLIEAVAGEIVVVPCAVFVVVALPVVEDVLGADDTANAGQFHAAPLYLFSRGVGVVLARVMEVGGVGV